MESTAAAILTRAVNMDREEQFTAALILYQEGVQILLNSMKDIKDQHKRKHVHERTKEYLERAEKVKAIIDQKKAAGQYREQTKIEAGSTGHGYASVFGRFLDDSVTKIEIEDPYIRTHHQCMNLVRLCELAVQKCSSLSIMSLITTRESTSEAAKHQIMRLNEIKQSLRCRFVTFEYSFSDTLHDRQIRLSSGWVVKIGRGLDYFKASEGKFVLGACDLELRPCMETTVDIFHKSHFENP